MANFFTSNRKWIALAILACGALAAWWSSHGGVRQASPPVGEALAWRDVPLEPAIAQPAWTVPPAAVVGQVPAPAVAAPFAPHNPLEAPFPGDDGQPPPALGANYPASAPPRPSRTFQAEATRRARLPEFADPDAGAAGERPSLHQVVDGDTLASLAARYLGDAAQARVLFEANRDRLRDAEVLPIGIELRIPPPVLPAAASSAATEIPPALSTNFASQPNLPPLEPGEWGVLAPISAGALRREVPSATAPPPVANPAAAMPPERPTGAGRTHVVRRGDTLRALARHYYGDPSRYGEIVNANRGQLRDPNRLQVGAELIIP